MKDLQKLGGVAALVQALAYAVGFVGLLTRFTEYFVGDELDAAGRVAFVRDHLAVMQAWHVVLYVVFGVALVILALALHERLKGGTPSMMQAATAFGLLWAGLVLASGMISVVGMSAVSDLYGSDPALAAVAWQAIEIVANGIGGGVEVVGGLWLLLVSWSALRSDALSRALNYIGVVAGGASHADDDLNEALYQSTADPRPGSEPCNLTIQQRRDQPLCESAVGAARLRWVGASADNKTVPARRTVAMINRERVTTPVRVEPMLTPRPATRRCVHPTPDRPGTETRVSVEQMECILAQRDLMSLNGAHSVDQRFGNRLLGWQPR